MKKINPKIKYLSLLLLILLVFVVINRNYTPGVWLIGWDNLQSELNVEMNIQRAISAVWQEYQGVGLLGGMGHASDLVRLIVVYILSLFVPQYASRYVLVMLMLSLGPIGMWFFVNHILKKYSLSSTFLVTLISSSFYLLNLGTVQNFYVPFEPYYWLYGILPWLALSLVNYYETQKIKYLLIFFIISFLATPAGYLQTIFVVYFILFVLISLGYVLFGGGRGSVTRRLLASTLASVVIFITNSFWLLPVIYYTLTSSQVTLNAKMNTIATSEVQLSNLAYGDIKDISTLKGYWLSLQDFGSDSYQYLMAPWIEHLKIPGVEYFGYIFFGLALLGVIFVFRKKIWLGISLSVFLGLCIVILGGSNSFLGYIYDSVVNTVPLFGQIFRSPYTKIIVPLVFTFAVLVSYGLVSILNVVENKFKKISISLSFLISAYLLSSMILMCYPIFEGNLIYSRIKLKLPQEYLHLIDEVKGHEEIERIGLYPIQTHWGWNFYDWGYRGSGFLWYGIEQPILDRAFDVWSIGNETYYYEVTTALYANDTSRFQKVLEKYNLTHFLIDESVYVPKEGKDNLSYDDFRKLLGLTGAQKVWSEGSLSLYKLNTVKLPGGYVYTPGEYLKSASDTDYVRFDPIYQRWGDYIHTGSNIFPFTDLYKEKPGGVLVNNDEIGNKITATRKFNKGNYTLVVPPLIKGENITVPATLLLNGTNFSVNFYPFALVNGENKVSELPAVSVDMENQYEDLIVTLGNENFDLRQSRPVTKVVTLQVGDDIEIIMFDPNSKNELELQNQFMGTEMKECWEREGTKGELALEKSQDTVGAKVKDMAGCITFKLGNLANVSYMLSISQPFKSENGSRPYFCVLKQGEQELCENSDVFYTTPPSSNWAAVERTLILDPGVVYWYSLSAKPPDEKGKEWGISYKTPAMTVYPMVERITYLADAWDKISKSQEFEIEGNSLVVESYSSPSSINFVDENKVSNCDVFGRGNISKGVYEEYNLYVASDRSTLCDYSFVDGVSLYDNYLLRVQTKNILGNNLKIYLYNNASKRSDIEDTLHTSDQIYSILDWDKLSDLGYTLNLQNRSFGGEKAENELNGVFFYKYPVNWYSTWYLVEGSNKFNVEGQTDIKKIHNNLDLIEVNKYRTYNYEVDVRGRGVFILSQGFNSGWVAYIQGKGSLLRNTLGHYKAKGWANAWEIKGDECLDGCKVVITYVPQYLENFGFILIVLGAVALGVVLYKRRKV